MSTYDFTAASDFLRYEADTTPEQLSKEVWAAWRNVSDIETRRNRKVAEAIRDTLLTCADFLERITPKEERRAV